jgi:DNA-directed RNA polymerase specialized sigma24 family protein
MEKTSRGVPDCGEVIVDDNLFRDLIDRAGAGDTTAAAVLYRRFAPELRRLARWLHQASGGRLRGEADSEDLVQSTFARLLSPGGFGQEPATTPRDLLNRLRRILENRLNDHARRRQVFRQYLEKLAADPWAGGDWRTEPDRLTIQDEFDRVSRLARQHFDQITWDAFRAFHTSHEGAGWEAIAEAVGWPLTPHALGVRVGRSIKSFLADYVGDQGERMS